MCTPRIRIDYLKSMLQERGYYTVFEEAVRFQVFQLVWIVPPKKKKVLTSESKTIGPLDVALYRLRVFNMPEEFEDGVVPDTLNVFEEGMDEEVF